MLSTLRLRLDRKPRQFVQDSAETPRPRKYDLNRHCLSLKSDRLSLWASTPGPASFPRRSPQASTAFRSSPEPGVRTPLSSRPQFPSFLPLPTHHLPAPRL